MILALRKGLGHQVIAKRVKRSKTRYSTYMPPTILEIKQKRWSQTEIEPDTSKIDHSNTTQRRVDGFSSTEEGGLEGID